MVALQKITAAMFDDLYGSYLDDDDPHLRKDDWRALLVPPGDNDEPGTGYVLRDGDKIVGMLGMIFSERMIEGVSRKFCNLHSWFVDDAYRGYSLMLMRPALRLTDHTLTDFTPTDRVCTISTRLGFRSLDSRLKILLPSPWTKGHSDIELVDDTDQIAGRLSAADLRLMRDHTRDRFYHLLVEDGDDYCYLIFNRVDRHVMPYCHLHYIGNKSVFARHESAIRKQILRTGGGRYVAMNARLAGDMPLRSSLTVPVSTKQLYRSSDVPPEQVDTLYSEVSLLWLTTFPDASHMLRRCVGRVQDILPGRSKAVNPVCNINSEPPALT